MFTNKSAVGVDIGTNQVKMVYLSRGKIAAYGSISSETPLRESDGTISHPHHVKMLLSQLRKQLGIPKGPAVTGFYGGKTLLRAFRLPLMRKLELQDALRWQIKELLPYPLDEASIDFAVVNRDLESKRQLVLVLAAPRTLVNDTKGMLQEAGFRPRIIETEATALSRIVRLMENPAGAYSVLDIGQSGSTLAISMGPFPMMVKEIPVGGERFTTVLADTLNIDFGEAEKQKLAEINPGVTPDFFAAVLRNFLADIYRNLRYHQQQYPDARVGTIYITGGSAVWPGLVETIRSNLDLPCQILSIERWTDSDTRSKGTVPLTSYATAAGYAAALTRMEGNGRGQIESA